MSDGAPKAPQKCQKRELNMIKRDFSDLKVNLGKIHLFFGEIHVYRQNSRYVPPFSRPSVAHNTKKHELNMNKHE